MKAILELGKLRGEFEVGKPQMFYELILPKNEMKAQILKRGEELEPLEVEAARLIFELVKVERDICFYSYRRMEEA